MSDYVYCCLWGTVGHCRWEQSSSVQWRFTLNSFTLKNSFCFISWSWCSCRIEVYKELQRYFCCFLNGLGCLLYGSADFLASKARTHCCQDTVHLLGSCTTLLWKCSHLWQLIIIFLACNWNHNGYAASASTIFVNHLLGNTVSMSRYVLVLCIVISQCLHWTLVFYFRDPFPSFFPFFFFLNQKDLIILVLNRLCFNTRIMYRHSLRDLFSISIFNVVLLFKGYTHLFIFLFLPLSC